MKRNFAMTIAACLLVVTMLSLCMVSSTYAKYTTTNSAQDEARVAYWGFKNTTAIALDLFDAEYDGSVKSNDGANVIAPGATKTSPAFAILNADSTLPEVKYEFKVDVSASSIDTLIENNPNIQWKLDDGSWGTWEALLNAIKALSGDASGTKVYDAGVAPAAFQSTSSHTVSWQWIFSTNAAGDTADTAMGNSTTPLEVELVIQVTATQVD